MSVQETETAITHLPAPEVMCLMFWLSERHAQVWDRQIEDDLEASRLGGLLAEVDAECWAGLARSL